jgi:hypothetical protein
VLAEVVGSNPSRGAYLEGISEYYGADERKNSPNWELKHKLQQPAIMNIYT